MNENKEPKTQETEESPIICKPSCRYYKKTKRHVMKCKNLQAVCPHERKYDE
jgi:hypothetical protein